MAFLLFLNIVMAAGSGNLFLQLVSFNNPNGVDASGFCCDNFFRQSNCFDSCDHQFHFCFRKKLRDKNCTLYEVTTDSISSNQIDFGDKITNVTNPIKIKFDKWNGMFGLTITVSDHDDNDNDPIGVIDYRFQSKQRKKAETITKKSFSLSFRIEISCDLNFFGTDCSTFCLPNDSCHCHPTSGQLLCPKKHTTTTTTTTTTAASTTAAAVPTNFVKSTEILQPLNPKRFLVTNPDPSPRTDSQSELDWNLELLQDIGTKSRVQQIATAGFGYSELSTKASSTLPLQKNFDKEERRNFPTRISQIRIPPASKDGSTVLYNCSHLMQFNYKEFQYKIKSFEDLNMFTIEVSLKEENVRIAYLLFNTIGNIFPSDKCLLEVVMLTQDLDLRNESREVLVKYVARFNGTGFYLPLSTEEMILKHLQKYSAELFSAPNEQREQKLPIVSKRISRLVVIIIGSCTLFVIFTLLMLGMYFLCQIERGHYNVGRTYSYAIEDIKGMQETDARMNSIENTLELKDLQDDHHIIPYENGF